MNTTRPSLPPAPSSPAMPCLTVSRLRGSASLDRPTWGDMLDQSALIDAPAFFGPPIIFVLAPWLLLVLLLIGPFVLVLTLMLVLAVAAALLAVLVAVIASPYLLIRHRRAHDIDHATPRASLHLVRTPRVSSGRLGPFQAERVS